MKSGDHRWCQGWSRRRNRYGVPLYIGRAGMWNKAYRNRREQFAGYERLRDESQNPKNLARNSAHEPSKPGNKEPDVIPIILNSVRTFTRSLLGKSITVKYDFEFSFSLDFMYDSISSIFVIVDSACCGIIRSFPIPRYSAIEKCGLAGVIFPSWLKSFDHNCLSKEIMRTLRSSKSAGDSVVKS